MRHFLSLKDYSKEEIIDLLDLAAELKAKDPSEEFHPLKGKSLAMILQQPSSRTRVSFEVGMYQLGGTALNILPSEIKMGEREPVRDIARVISRYVDGIMIRAKKHEDIVEMAKFSSAPVINGLSELYHPCQALADALTIVEKKGEIAGTKLCYIGDGNNVCRSLVNLSKLLGMEITIVSPKGYELEEVETVYDPKEGISGADVVYTDTWTSMGQEAENKKREKAFAGLTITSELLAQASKDVIFMHCLPAYRGLEVEDDVAEGPHSVIFDQAENRLHAQKAILATLLQQ